jgi:hypothetical protein
VNICGLLRKAKDPDRSGGSGTPRNAGADTLLRRIRILICYLTYSCGQSLNRRNLELLLSKIAAPLGSFRGKLLPYAVKGRTASERNDFDLQPRAVPPPFPAPRRACARHPVLAFPSTETKTIAEFLMCYRLCLAKSIRPVNW